MQFARHIAEARQYDVSVKLRNKVEILFADLSRILGLGQLPPCCLSGANDEFLGPAATQNLRKPAKVSPKQQQIRKA